MISSRRWDAMLILILRFSSPNRPRLTSTPLGTCCILWTPMTTMWRSWERSQREATNAREVAREGTRCTRGASSGSTSSSTPSFARHSVYDLRRIDTSKAMMTSCFDQMDRRISDLENTTDAMFDEVHEIWVTMDALQVVRPSSS